jgi:Trk K+ transport system NAD-binding subunit
MMARTRRSRLTRPFAWLALLPIGVLVVALIYMLGMAHLESEPRDFWQALAWAAETMTTTGYGHDNRWGHPLMITFVVAVQFVGVFLVFLVLPVFAIPYLESRFESRLPRTLPAKLHDYVLIYRHGPAVASLIGDLQREQIPTVVVEEDEALARRLRDRGATVVYTRIADENPLSEGLDRARALILNGEDHDNAVFVLSARQNGFEGPIYAFVENPIHRKPIELAGATAAYSPKHALAAALAAQASHRISPRIAGLHQLGEDLEVAEMRVHRDSPVAGTTLAEARIRERTGATVVGQWIGGSFTTEMGPRTVLRRRAILVAVGSHESIQRLGRLATSLDRTGPVLVAGYGRVGHKVVQMLRDAGEQTTSIDGKERAGVDLVGDALEVDTLRRAGVETARAVILALASDSTNLFAAAIVRDLAPEVPIIARVSRAEDVSRMHAAGADFALSISEVAGQLLARRLLGEEFVSLETQVRLVKVSAAGLTGLDPVAARIPERTGCSIAAIQRGEEILVELDREFEIEDGDCIYLCGSREAVMRYFRLFPEARSAPET